MDARISGFISTAVCLAFGSVTASVDYTYENDGKTLVATVPDAVATLTTSAEEQALFTDGITNFVKRGDNELRVWENVAGSFTGDIRIEAGNLSFYANSLGINSPQGKVQISKGRLVHIGNKHLTIARDIEYCSADANNPDWGGRSLEVWDGRSATVTGKVTIGDKNAYALVYKGGSLDFTGGIEDALDVSSCGYFYVGAYNGSTMTFAEKPVKLTRMLYFNIPGYVSADPDKYRDASGYVGRYIFSAPGNIIASLGFENNSANSRFRLCELKTTVDWAFDNAGMVVRWGNDARWDLCGTKQRVGQFDIKMSTGNPSIVTNSLETPATLYLGMIYGPNSSPGDIRFGGNLSVNFWGDIYTTLIDHEMTARGDLTIEANGRYNKSTLAFTENGSWVNATNVTVKGDGKITIANPNALGKKTAVNLASESSLDIASGVTVNVRYLTVGGVERRPGSYTFGSGTLVVSGKPGIKVILR